MKNIMIIDGAVNCVYDIFSASDEDFSKLFPPGTDIAFIDEIYAKGSESGLDLIFKRLWQNRVEKSKVNGIHGTIFYELDDKKPFYPTRKDEEAINPDGTRLR